MKCLDCNYGCGTPRSLLFHYKTEHKDKVGKCASGDESISGNCVEVISSKFRGSASKCSSSNSCSSFSFNPSSNSTSSSIFSSSSNTNSDSNSNSNSNSSAKSNSIPFSIPITNPDPNPKNSLLETKFEITNKFFNRCRVIKRITSFDQKKSLCNECNSTKVKCEYCTSLLSFSGLKGHIKNSYKEINLLSGVYSVNVLESINKIKPVNEFIKSNPLDGEAWSRTHKSNPIDKSNIIEKFIITDKSDTKDKSNSIDGEALAKPFHGWTKSHGRSPISLMNPNIIF